MIRTALRIAMSAHKNQVDKAGKPYILHPLSVASGVESDDAYVAALLHDVIEDSEYTADDLLDAGIPERIVEALLLLTHDKSEPYFDYVRRIKKNPIAREVKLSDLSHNMDLSRLPVVTEKDLERVEKYKKAKAILIEEI